jgi:hypothetical protein
MLFVTNSVQLLQRMPYQALEGFVDFEIGGQIIHTVKYADDIVLLAKEETVLQDVIDKLIQNWKMLGNGNECGKNKSNENFNKTIPSRNYDRQKQLENVKSFKYLGSMLTNDGRCICEIKSRTAMAKVAFNKKVALFTSTLDLKLRKKLVKFYIWSIALYGAETWTIRADQKRLESFEMWCWRRMEKIS